jgi:predicted DsbA family dithiol-disulfide isomerase
MSPVRITEFTDILCEHCAGLNETLRTLRQNVPPGSYSVDSRQFPLDGRCNPLLKPGGDRDDVRCVAAKLRICAEPSGKEPELASALFEKQDGLTRPAAMDIATRFLPRSQIDSCLDSREVQQTLEQDVAAASRFDSDGTPIVAVNGRKGTSFAPFLYAIILNRGKPDNPAFEALPPGNPAAHLH